MHGRGIQIESSKEVFIVIAMTCRKLSNNSTGEKRQLMSGKGN